MERQFKFSGNSIIGKIPAGWQMKRLKDVGYLYGGLTGKAGEDFEVNEDKDNFAYFIPFTNIFNNTYISPDVLGKVKFSDGEKQNEVHKGDLLFLMSSEDYDGIGKPAVLNFELANLYLNSFCKGFRITSDVNSKFLNYLMSSHVERELVRLEARGFIRINLRQDKLACCDIIIPSRLEQDRIADYLDEKCGEIDSLIGLQEQMIEKLKAYRQSVITEAVTKGLDPNAKLVPSGIDWIGEIPEGWLVTDIKKLCISITDGSHFSPERQSEGMPYITAGDIKGKGIDYNNAMRIRIEDYNLLESQGCRPHKGDVLMVKDGATTGRVGMMTDNEECVLLSSVAMLTPLPNVDSNYLMYLIQSNVIQAQIQLLMAGSAMPRVTLKKINSLKGLLIPLNDQHSIASYLDEKCADIDRLIALKQQKIESLKDYKKSVIYEAVTGKTIIE